MPGPQHGKVAIITGGTANMGRMFAQSLASDGASLVVHYNSPRRADEAAGTVKELQAMGVEAAAHQGDLTDRAQLTRLVDTAVERFETTEDEFGSSFNINAKIPFFLMSEASTKMADQGRIINLVTTQVAVTAATYSCYAGSKSPVEHFTKALAKEIGGRGITVDCVAPGPQKTSFLYGAETDDTLKWLSDQTISGELGDPADVVPVVRFLAAPETRWVTAQTVYVNGGMISPIN